MWSPPKILGSARNGAALGPRVTRRRLRGGAGAGAGGALEREASPLSHLLTLRASISALTSFSSSVSGGPPLFFPAAPFMSFPARTMLPYTKSTTAELRYKSPAARRDSQRLGRGRNGQRWTSKEDSLY